MTITNGGKIIVDMFTVIIESMSILSLKMTICKCVQRHSACVSARTILLTHYVYSPFVDGTCLTYIRNVNNSSLCYL